MFCSPVLILSIHSAGVWDACFLSFSFVVVVLDAECLVLLRDGMALSRVVLVLCVESSQFHKYIYFFSFLISFC